MKKYLFLAIVLFCCHIGFAQSDLLVHANGKQLYLTHTVSPKENFYSIGRLYNVSAKDIAAVNQLDMNKGLNIGQQIRIPLNDHNFSQKSSKGRAVYYVVGDNEGLYRVSTKNGGVLMADLRKWNHLASDQLQAGKKLIVGFLQSAEADKIPGATVQQPGVKTQTKEVEAVAEPVARKEVKAVAEKTEPVRKADPAPAASKPSTPISVANDANGGYFKSSFDRQLKSQPASTDVTATAGIFKTASGWQDAKYYALMDNVEPGTIVRIVNPTNNKAVYAKVLGEMSGIRQNQGYDIRMSNAAATALDINDAEKFVVKVNY
jgi:LysM repeat protein